jgi:hypothetical protein
MIKVSIYAGETLTNAGTFDTQAEAEQWVAYHGFSEPVYEDITAKLEQSQINSEAQSFLDSTDYKILRHLGQQALGLATSLTAQEYFELEQERQAARERIVR